MFVIMFGMPGSGKDTQSNRLANTFNIPHYSTGAILRKAAETDTELATFLEGGGLVNDNQMNDIIGKLIRNDNDVGWGMVLNGYPRNIEQAKYLDTTFPFDAVMYLDIDEETAIQRILDGNRGRTDDTETTIKERLSVYREKTLPVLDYFQREGITPVLKIDASADPDTVAKFIIQELWKIRNDI